MQRSNALLKGFSGHIMKSKGRVMIRCIFHKETFHIPFEVVEVKTPTTLESCSSQEMDSYKRCLLFHSQTMETDEDLTEQFI